MPTSSAPAASARLAVRFPHLRAYLSSVSRRDDALNFEQLLGFLYAVSSAPDVVEASEWMRFVLVDSLPTGDDGAEAERIVAEMLDLYHAIERQVFECRVELPQECAPRPDALANLDPDCGLSRWSQGFSVGHGWLEEAWDACVNNGFDDELDWQLAGCMAVLCFFASREVAEALHEEFRADALSLEERAVIMISLFPGALDAYADIGRCLAAGGSDAQIGVAKALGAVAASCALCPCGSGRAFGVCCGASRFVH